MADGKYWLLLSRNNLVDVLSGGLIKPAKLIAKYYLDAGQLCDSGVFLLAQPPSLELVTSTTPEARGQFPVLARIDLGAYSGPCAVIRSDYRGDTGRIPVQNEHLAVVLAGVLPSSCIEMVYFRSDTELKEFDVRGYENLRMNRDALRVDRALFDGMPVDLIGLGKALATINAGLILPAPELTRRMYAIGGAALMAGSMAQREPGLPRGSLQALFDGIIGGIGEGGRSAPPATWANHIGLVLSGLLTESPLPRARQSAAFNLIEILVRRLLSLDTMSFYGQGFLREVAVEFRSPSPQVRPDDYEKLDGAISKVQDVIGNRAEIADFPVEEAPVVTALLYFLLHNQPAASLDAWKNLRVPPESAFIAVILVGVLRGRSLIPVDCRPGIDYENLVDELAAASINAAVKGVTVSPQARLAEQLTFQKVLRRDETPQTAAAKSLETGKPSIDVFKVLIEADLSKPGVEQQAALHLCRVAKWDDCVTSVITLKHRTFILHNAEGDLKVRIQGFPVEPVLEIRSKEFRGRLTRVAWNNLTNELKLTLSAILRGEMPDTSAITKKKATRSTKPKVTKAKK